MWCSQRQVRASDQWKEVEARVEAAAEAQVAVGVGVSGVGCDAAEHS